MWMLLIPIALFSGIIAGMGVGGGSIFILLTTIFHVFEHKEAQGYNLIMFVIIGISATIYHIKQGNLDKKLVLKLVIPVCLGSITGVILVKFLDENMLRYAFYGFMLIIGIYEIISSLIRMKRAKNNTERS